MLRQAAFWLLLAVLACAALFNMRLGGDGGEYLMTAHALLRDGSLVVTPEAIADSLRLPPATQERIGFPAKFYAELVEVFRTPQPRSYGGYASVAPDQLYSMHFWGYSLLALPFFALTRLAGANPALAFGLLNLALAGFCCAFLRRVMPQHWRWAALLFLFAGTNFYLRWTGPEVMSAVCALVAAVALLRGQLGAAILMAGIGSSQMPPLVLLMPFAVGFRLLLVRFPQLAWPGAAVAKPGARDLVLVLAGVLAAATPYLFFHHVFGEPSLTGRYFTMPGLISVQRLFSLLFDLDQGMLAGVPGVFGGLLAAPWLMGTAQRQRWAVAALCIAAACAAMIVPALATLNWNSGSVVFIRYGYWAAMPLLALVLLAMAHMAHKRAAILALIVLAPQALPMFEHGVLGHRSNWVRHGAAAAWALERIPGLYHPDPEIFIERGQGREGEMPLPHAAVHLHAAGGRPVKLLRHLDNTGASDGLCMPGERLEGSAVHALRGGWRYEHAPFLCRQLPRMVAIASWTFNTAHPGNQAVLGAGWSGPEPGGVWTEGTHSSLTLPVPAGPARLRLLVDGFYYGGQQTSELTLNGQPMGAVSLLAPIELAANGSGALVLHLVHAGAVSPAERGESADTRKLAFHLRKIVIERIVPPADPGRAAHR